MTKRIALLLDGTWDDPESDSNIFKFSQLIGQSPSQQIHYVKGIGTHPGHTFWNKLINAIEGGTGTSVSHKILRSYRYICQNYQPGDQLFIFGFSRGSFEARSLVGLISYCGLISAVADQEKFHQLTQRAFHYYQIQQNSHYRQEAEQFIQQNCITPIPIEFLGVFDTVGALGIPIEQDQTLLEKFMHQLDHNLLQFFDTKLSDNVHYAYQALAIDEHRYAFLPTLWNNCPTNTQMEQVWFAGCHCNIGGGYPGNHLSDEALAWMYLKAQKVGLEFSSPYHAAINAYADPIENSYETFVRQYGAEIAGKPVTRQILDPQYPNQWLHVSVLHRLDDTALEYSPQNTLVAEGQPLKDISHADLQKYILTN
ncbi:DUF2235 domain-containing protein [Celerinatantimonas sp. YJH-8]|uniref:DUF2235 domain-containing protein n=1 Tax=Celerinatantimonas sp. YJH-8 TaxID=3228714 RepID=UPI0038C326B6